MLTGQEYNQLLNHYKKNVSALHLDNFFDDILDTQTHLSKQSTHEDQTLNIDPAPLVPLTQYLNGPTKQITTHILLTMFSSYSQANLAPQDCLSQNILTTARDILLQINPI